MIKMIYNCKDYRFCIKRYNAKKWSNHKLLNNTKSPTGQLYDELKTLKTR